jgi:hypothetical protein
VIAELFGGGLSNSPNCWTGQGQGQTQDQNLGGGVGACVWIKGSSGTWKRPGESGDKPGGPPREMDFILIKVTGGGELCEPAAQGLHGGGLT